MLCIILASGGCGKDGNSSGSGQIPGIGSGAVSDTEELMAYKDIRYLPEFTDTTDRYDAYGSMGIGFVEDTFYLFQKELSGYSVKSCQLVAYNPNTGEEKLIFDDTNRDGRMVAATLLKDGSAMVLSICTSGYRLSRVEPDGNEVFVREYADNLDILPDPGFVADGRGRCCLQVQEELILFDEQGRASGFPQEI